MNPRYRRLTLACDLSIAALEEAAAVLKPRRAYKLYVSPSLWVLGCMILRTIGATVKEHPFAPYINLVQVDDLKPGEWFIEGDAGEAVGSEGV